MPDTEILYKTLTADGRGPYSRSRWELPRGRRGKWMPPVARLVHCVSGYHLCREGDLVQWLDERIYTAEYRGDRIDGDNKIVVAEARLVKRLDTWNERTARLFACDCAARALRRITRKFGKQDKRSGDAIKVARRFANGEATANELTSAARAASAAWAERAASAAWSASAAWAARAESAESAAERKWQTKRLHEYLRGERG